MSRKQGEKYYLPINTDTSLNCDSTLSDEGCDEGYPTQRNSYIKHFLTIRNLLLAILLLSLIDLTVQLTSFARQSTSKTSPAAEASPQCTSPVRRQEWRSASPSARTHYLDAVLCLMQKPSILHPTTSRYDDFVYAHITTGQYSHYAAAFLPWHRYYLHVFEKTLKSECGYKGNLFYWDWSLDAHDLGASPIWDPQLGFGGNGNPDLPTRIYRGSCVTEGPFANTTRAYLSTNPTWRQGVAYAPHCLARGFFNGPQLAELQHNVSKEAVETLLQQDSFEDFFQTFEVGSHQVIPSFIQGDFMTYTAPNDPVFFLHHAQVDRVWWLWQQQNPEVRLWTVEGAKIGPSAKMSGHDSEEEHAAAGLDNLLPIGGLDVDVFVRDVMDTTDGFLCYDYATIK